MTLAESAARGALAMFWFQAASVASDGARGESDAGGAGKTVHEPRSAGRRRGARRAEPSGRAASAQAGRASRRAPPCRRTSRGPHPDPMRARSGCAAGRPSRMVSLPIVEVVDDELLDLDSSEGGFVDLQALDREAADREAADRHRAERGGADRERASDGSAAAHRARRGAAWRRRRGARRSIACAATGQAGGLWSSRSARMVPCVSAFCDPQTPDPLGGAPLPVVTFGSLISRRPSRGHSSRVRDGPRPHPPPLLLGSRPSRDEVVLQLVEAVALPALRAELVPGSARDRGFDAVEEPVEAGLEAGVRRDAEVVSAVRVARRSS